MLATQAPYSQYFDKNGDPLDNGLVYFGLPSQNPETSPIPVYWDIDGTQPVAQPARTLAGYIVRNGTPARVYAEGAYSVTVRNRKGEMVYYAPTSSDFSDLPVNRAVITATNGQTLVTLPFAYTRGNNSLQVFVNGLIVRGNGVDYTETTTTSVTFANGLSAGDEVEALGGALLNPANALGMVSDVALAADDGSALVGHIASGTGAGTRTLQAKARDIVSSADFDTLTNALAQADEVAIVDNKTISANESLPRGKGLRFLKGALTIATGVTLTIACPVYAQARQIFSGAGTVLGIKDVRPEWWGVARNGTTDDAAAFQKAQACIEASGSSDGDRCVLRMLNGSYALASTVIVNPTAAFRIDWEGMGGAGGTTIVGRASFTGTSVLSVTGNTNTTVGASFKVSGFRVIPQTANSGATVGILVGGSGTYALQGGPHQSCIFEDVGVYDFPQCWQVRNARLIQWQRCGGWVETITGARSIRILASALGEFTGDLDFYSCQMVANANDAIALDVEASGTGTISGLGFHSHIMYAGKANIVASGGSRCCDIWFNPRCQYDVVTKEGFQILATGAGSRVYNVNILNNYFSGGLVAAYKLVNIFTALSGSVKSVKVTGNHFRNTIGDVVYTNGTEVSDISVDDNTFVDNDTGNMVTIGAGVATSSASGNKTIRDARTVTPDAVVKILVTADRYVVTNNNAGGLAVASVSDSGGAVTKTVSGNI